MMTTATNVCHNNCSVDQKNAKRTAEINTVDTDVNVKVTENVIANHSNTKSKHATVSNNASIDLQEDKAQKVT